MGDILQARARASLKLNGYTHAPIEAHPDTDPAALTARHNQCRMFVAAAGVRGERADLKLWRADWRKGLIF